MFRFSVLGSSWLEETSGSTVGHGENRLEMASHGYQNSFVLFCFFFLVLDLWSHFFLFSNDSSLHLLLIPFTLPSITPVVPVPVQMSSMPRN